MKQRFIPFAAAAVVAISCAGCSPAASIELGDTVNSPGVFSFKAPKGWTITSPALGYPKAEGPAQRDFTPDIVVSSQGYQSVDRYAKTYNARLMDVNYTFSMNLTEQKPFTTATGVKGVRLVSIDVMNPPTAEQVSYAFTGPGGLLLVFSGASAPGDFAHWAPVFDACIKTLVIGGGQ